MMSLARGFGILSSYFKCNIHAKFPYASGKAASSHTSKSESPIRFCLPLQKIHQSNGFLEYNGILRLTTFNISWAFQNPEGDFFKVGS
ncbi:hypothetical protein I7I53_07266 [Histoplasma capsulatum var. duboisii H88]|uniref:Uncharacterized protein n=1 Tax=Ajellomyces capsulatus (strain H88) TaxID=544711 RepID=A0A8A1LIM3_AJEC8|nr:hypothetical protein I7I53_07266 [Histoplasma capsulatum var. duboisii H88]